MPVLIHLPNGAPKEGNAVVPVQTPLTPGQTATMFAAGRPADLSRVASILVDATRAFSGFELVFSDTGRRIVIPSGSESCHRTFSAGGTFTVQNLDQQYNAIFKAWLFSCPQPVYERFPGAALSGDVLANARLGEFAVNPGGKVATYSYEAPKLPLGTTWDSALVTPGMTLSENGLRVNISNTGGAMRTPAYRSSGKYYWELDGQFTDNPTYPFKAAPGFANTLQGDGKDNRPYGDILLNKFTDVFLGGVKIGTMGSSAGVPGGMDHGAFAIDIDKGLMWWRPTASFAWFGNAAGGTPDPASGTAGFDVSALPKPWAPCYVRRAYDDDPRWAKIYTGNVSLGGGLTGVVPAGFQPGWPAV